MSELAHTNAAAIWGSLAWRDGHSSTPQPIQEKTSVSRKVLQDVIRVYDERIQQLGEQVNSDHHSHRVLSGKVLYLERSLKLALAMAVESACQKSTLQIGLAMAEKKCEQKEREIKIIMERWKR